MTSVDRERAALKRRNEWLDDLQQDLRYGVRSLVRAPVFSLLAIVTLALGIGANAAVFGVVKSVLLDALPYADADRLVRIYGRTLDGSLERMPLSAGTVTDIGARQRSFAGVAAFDGGMRDVIYAGSAGPSVLKAAYVEPRLFPTLGAGVTLGRTFTDDDAAVDTVRAVLLTHVTWQRLFAGDAGIVGKSMLLNGVPRIVVGVLPPHFVGPLSGAEAYFPLNLAPVMRDAVFARRSQWLGLVGRLKDGATIDAAQRDLTALGADLAREYPQYNGTMGVAARPMREDMAGETRAPLLVLMASAGLILLITCANLAGALLSRALSRRKEFSIRVALGAGRGRLVRQLLTESAVLAMSGGAAGLVLASLGLRFLRGLALPSLPSYADLSLDPGAVLVTSVVALITGIAFGIVPAMAGGRANQEGGLREEGRAQSESGRSRRLRGLLVAGQIALCLSLLAGAGLLARSLWAMMATPLGFDPDGLLTVAVQLPRAGYSKTEDRIRFMEQFEARVRALPGVVDVASTGEVPTQVRNRNGFVAEGAVPLPGDIRPPVLYSTASDDFFRTLGIPLRAGRTFGPAERPDTPPVIIISESMARRYWPAGDAVGSRVRMGSEADAPAVTIIGVVGDVRSDPARRDAEPVMYMSIRHNPWNGPIFVIRTRGNALSLVKPIQQTLAEIDPGLPMHNVTTLRAVLADGLAGRRLPVVLMAAFGGLALLVASVGVYAMFAAMAAAREREFGIRMALGSRRSAIATLVLRQGGVWMLAGLAAGAGGVIVVARLVRSLLVGVAPFDPVALGLAVLALTASATVALLVPVLRATRIDPISTLR